MRTTKTLIFADMQADLNLRWAHMSDGRVFCLFFLFFFRFVFFFFFFFFVCFVENGVLLMYKLESVSSVANFITAYEDSQ